MIIELRKKEGIVLKTKDKICEEDITIIPKFQQGTGSNVEFKTLNCDLDFVDPISEEVARQMSFVAPEGTAYKSVYINRPATLIPKYIRKGINIAGVVGSFEPVVENVVRYPYAEGVMF